MARVVVVGGALPGLAAAARLARAGHDVTVVDRRHALGGPLAEPGAMSPIIDLPAAWRDLFAKTGRPAAGTLGARGLTLVPAPPTRHVLHDGTIVDLPSDRGDQWRALSATFSERDAASWRDLVDHHDDVWQAVRMLGLERELVDRSQIDRVSRVLEPDRSVADVAARLGAGPAAELVRASAEPYGDPDATPAWLLSRLSVQRTFGRWVLVDRDGLAQPAHHLVAMLADRARERGVRALTGVTAGTIAGRRVETGHGPLDADAVISTVDLWDHAALAGRPAPRIARVRDGDNGRPGAHAARGPAWERPRRGLLRRPFTFTDQWLARPPIRDAEDDRLFHASASSRGGAEPWAQLLSAALAAYACHEVLTGEDIRPTNRNLARR